MTSQGTDSKTEEVDESTWSKVDLDDGQEQEPYRPTHQVRVTTNADEDGNESETSQTETAIIHHSPRSTSMVFVADYAQYGNRSNTNSRAHSPKKHALPQPPNVFHRKQQSTIASALDSYVSGGTLQESLKQDLQKLFEEEFKQEFMYKNEQIQFYEVEARKWKSESEARSRKYNDLETRFRALAMKQSNCQKQIDVLQSLAAIKDKQNVMRSICQGLGLQFINTETPYELANRIDDSLAQTREDTDVDLENNRARDSIDKGADESLSTPASVAIGVAVGLVIGYFTGNPDSLMYIVDNLSKVSYPSG